MRQIKNDLIEWIFLQAVHQNIHVIFAVFFITCCTMIQNLTFCLISNWFQYHIFFDEMQACLLFFFSNISIKSWYFFNINNCKSIYDFRFKTFSIFFIITVKILWSCFHASMQNDSTFIWQISNEKCLLLSNNIFLWFFAFNLSWLCDVSCVMLSDNNSLYCVMFE